MKKTDYLSPALEVISLHAIQETMQVPSYNGTGENLGDPVTGGDLEDIFTVGGVL